MRADRAWIARNVGFDPVAVRAPMTTFAVRAAANPRAKREDLQREIIDFDSEGPEGLAFFAFSNATGLSRFTDIPWPKNLAPKTDAAARKGKSGALPKADVLAVTWTVDEGHALSRVLTPDKDSRNDYLRYRHNFAKIAKKMRKGCPTVNGGQLGSYWTSRIGGKKVVVFKLDSHLSQDTKHAPNGSETLPNEDVWRQIVDEVQPRLVFTTGTAGGIGTECEVGDVVVSPVVKFDCQRWLKNESFHDEDFDSAAARTKHFAKARQLFKANSARLPPDNKRPPRILLTKKTAHSVLTTDFFGFDTSDNRDKLQGLGSVCEMGDAVLGWPGAAWRRRFLAGSPCATSPIRRSKPKGLTVIRPTKPRRSTKRLGAGAPYVVRSCAGR